MNAILASLIFAYGVTADSNPDSVRQDAIWTAAHNRVVLQMDAWFEDGDFPRCIQLLKMMHAREPKDYETVTDLGWMLGNIELEDQELALYQKYKKDNPDDKESPFPEAQFYFLKRQYEKVIPLLAPVISKKPHPNAYRLLAHSYERTAQLEESKKVWDEYLALNPKDEAGKRNLERVVSKLSSKNGEKQ